MARHRSARPVRSPASCTKARSTWASSGCVSMPASQHVQRLLQAGVHRGRDGGGGGQDHLGAALQFRRHFRQAQHRRVPRERMEGRYLQPLPIGSSSTRPARSASSWCNGPATDRWHQQPAGGGNLQLLVCPVGGQGGQKAVAVAVDSEHGVGWNHRPSLIRPARTPGAKGHRARQPMAHPQRSISREVQRERRQATGEGERQGRLAGAIGGGQPNHGCKGSAAKRLQSACRTLAKPYTQHGLRLRTCAARGGS